VIEINIAREAESGWLRIIVRDTGGGILPKCSVWAKPSRSIQESSVQLRSGTGLGLASQSHRRGAWRTMHIDSKVGLGTT